MKKTRIEGGVVVGTSGGKYELKNPIAQYLLRGFDNAISEMAEHISPSSILEIGCGEGHVTQLLLKHTSATIVATDLSASVLSETKKLLASERVSYLVSDIEELEPWASPPEMVVCCEVLEHLQDPEKALQALLAQRAEWYILSVPREPIWRILNSARGAYIKDLGNSPGHIQHWNKHKFIRFLEQGGLKCKMIRTPLPWTAVLCQTF
ncbi:MAG: class I SAM-dependent methyltransferase [Desulfocapsa sp.]|nr:class I SAM-dependent methyltransferase [Desulfocapsa sp.]